MEFTVKILPERKAEFSGNQEELTTYLKESVIEYIPEGHFKEYQLAAVTFTVDENGQIINPNIFSSSEDESLDSMMIQAIRNMGKWNPAEYDSGKKVSQQYAFFYWK